MGRKQTAQEAALLLVGGDLLVREDTYDGEHVALHGDGVTLVDGAVEVDGQVRDGADGALQVHLEHLGLQGVGGAHGHAAGDGERTVEPGVEDAAAVLLDVEFEHSALAVDLGVGLDLEAGGVAVGGDDVEPVFGHVTTACHKGEDSGAVLGHIILAAGLEVPLVGGAEFCESGILEFFFYGVDSHHVARGGVHPFQQLFYHDTVFCGWRLGEA